MLVRMRTTLILLQFGLFGSLFGQYVLPIQEIKKELKRFSYSKSDQDFIKLKHFFFDQEYDSSLVYSSKYLESSKSNPKLHNYCRFFRGYSSEKKKLFSESKENYLQISNEFPFYDFVQMQLGSVELNSENYQKALDYFQYLEKSNSTPSYIDKGVLLNDIGVCYLHMENFAKSEAYLLKSANLLEADSADVDDRINTSINLANLYYNQYKDDEAIPYFEKAYLLSQKTNNFNLKMNTAINMSIVEENRQDFTRALRYRKEFDQWKDSLNDQNKVWEIAQLEKKFISEKGKKREEVLQAENRAKVAQRNGFIFSSTLLLILLGTGIYFYIQKLRSNRIILEQKKELGILNATKDRLFSVVSHDLRSNVNGLRLSNSKLTKYLDEENYGDLREIVRSNGSIANSTYSLLDNLLNWAMIQTEQLYFKIESVNLYSVVDQVSFNYLPLMEEKGISFKSAVPRNLMVEADLDSLKIILRNLIDNAIKYSGENGSISVRTKETTNHQCELVIEDKGQGMNKKVVQSLLKPNSSSEALGNGLGLQLCKDLIEKNKGVLTVHSELGVGTTLGIALQKSE